MVDKFLKPLKRKTAISNIQNQIDANRSRYDTPLVITCRPFPATVAASELQEALERGLAEG